MKLSIFTIVILLLFSCGGTKNENSTEGGSKIVSVFRPAFDEASEIVFIDEDSSRSLSILIRKNFRLDETEDTFYYKQITLNEKQVTMIKDAVLSQLDSTIYQKSSGIRDGIRVSYQYTQNADTTFYELHSPAKATAAYELTTATLDRYQVLFRDTIISDYFNDLRTYLTQKGYVAPKTMTPLKQLREAKYAGLMKYSR